MRSPTPCGIFDRVDDPLEVRFDGAVDEQTWKASLDPLVLAAAREVDVTLIDWALSLSPLERLRACSNATDALGRLADAAASTAR